MATPTQKAAKFRARCLAQGQSLTRFAYAGEPVGASLNEWTKEPDPESAAYGTSRLTPNYSMTAESFKGFIQFPQFVKEKMTRWGERLKVNARAFIPNDQAIEERDHLVHGGITYRILGVSPWYNGDTLIYTEVNLTKEVPTNA